MTRGLQPLQGDATQGYRNGEPLSTRIENLEELRGGGARPERLALLQPANRVTRIPLSSEYGTHKTAKAIREGICDAT